MDNYKRPVFETLLKRVLEKRHFIQILSGPRQVGKTTLARQVIEKCGISSQYVSADEPTLQDRTWLNQQWDIARTKTFSKNGYHPALLIIDEVQKITGWSETVKKLWDEDTVNKTPLKVMILGSSPLLVQKGLTESLAGRFELIPITHWSYNEMKKCFGFTLEQYIYFGCYPGAATLVNDHKRWVNYIVDSLIETTISRDVLLMSRIDKPALLRRLFHLGCEYSGQIVSYQKMIGQLQDAGNTTTLAHYLDLLNGAGLLRGLPKYAGQTVRQRASSPKLLVLNTALMTALSNQPFTEVQSDRNYWGRLVESAVGAHLVNDAKSKHIEIFYWLNRNREVDFVLRLGKSLTAIEVKSTAKSHTLPGTEAFCKMFPVKRQLLVGGQGISLEEFLTTPVEHWMM
jgi:predicted AAA+ superfamily ATPase